jgi:hypothetical protein
MQRPQSSAADFFSKDALGIPSPEGGILHTTLHLTHAPTAMFQFRRFLMILYEAGARSPLIIGCGKMPASNIFEE